MENYYKQLIIDLAQSVNSVENKSSDLQERKAEIAKHVAHKGNNLGQLAKDLQESLLFARDCGAFGNTEAYAKKSDGSPSNKKEWSRRAELVVRMYRTAVEAYSKKEYTIKGGVTACKIEKKVVAPKKSEVERAFSLLEKHFEAQNVLVDEEFLKDFQTIITNQEKRELVRQERIREEQEAVRQGMERKTLIDQLKAYIAACEPIGADCEAQQKELKQLLKQA